MRKLFLIIFASAAFLSLWACRDPIFYHISLEEKILEPKIQGSPTQFVVYNDKMYVASGTNMYEYSGTDASRDDRGIWNSFSPGGRILNITVAGSLYILCEESGKAVIKKLDSNGAWRALDSRNFSVRSIYGANGTLFIGASDLSKSYIFYGDNLQLLTETGNKLLNGVSHNGTYYYMSAKELEKAVGDIYFSDNALAGVSSFNTAIPFMGIINLKNSSNTTVAIDLNGKLYAVGSGINEIANMGDYLATGALAIYESNGSRLLLAGRQDKLDTSATSGYTYGYLEIVISAAGVVGSEFIEPGINSPSTVTIGDNGRYKSTIGKNPVNHIFQVPLTIDRCMTLFASTQKNGVWSYRDRDGVQHWNAEQ